MRVFIFQFITIVSLITLSCKDNVKVNDSDVSLLKYQKEVLTDNKPSKEYFFKTVPSEGYLEYSIVYLGKTTTAKRTPLKFLNCITYSGLLKDSRRANSSICIFNENDELLGYYQVGPIWSLPKALDGSNLVFDYNDEYCNQRTLISYSDSIPNNIFILCTEKGGDVYNFSTGE